MAITIESSETRSICVQEYMEYVERNVDPNDVASIAESGHMLKALKNNRTFLIDFYNTELTKTLEKRLYNFLSPQSYMISASNDGRFGLRSNIWTVPSVHQQQREMESRLFSYNMAHDHNFNFLTVGYYGPGYETVIYEYDSTKYTGYIGEEVALNFLERTTLPEGKLMLYRAAHDVHIQLPPEKLSISLNLLLNVPANSKRGQYYIDVDRQEISGYPEGNLASRRVALINFVRYFHNEKTLEIVETIAEQASCTRTKIAAVDALGFATGNELGVLERFATHTDSVMQSYARRKLSFMSKKNGERSV